VSYDKSWRCVQLLVRARYSPITSPRCACATSLAHHMMSERCWVPAIETDAVGQRQHTQKSQHTCHGAIRRRGHRSARSLRYCSPTAAAEPRAVSQRPSTLHAKPHVCRRSSSRTYLKTRKQTLIFVLFRGLLVEEQGGERGFHLFHPLFREPAGCGGDRAGEASLQRNLGAVLSGMVRRRPRAMRPWTGTARFLMQCKAFRSSRLMQCKAFRSSRSFRSRSLARSRSLRCNKRVSFSRRAF
jgi:hypothetical protein